MRNRFIDATGIAALVALLILTVVLLRLIESILPGA